MARRDIKLTPNMYYIKVKSGQQNISISRKEKKRAFDAYKNYLKIGKRVEWMGLWNGKKFEETSLPKES